MPLTKQVDASIHCSINEHPAQSLSRSAQPPARSTNPQWRGPRNDDSSAQTTVRRSASHPVGPSRDQAEASPIPPGRGLAWKVLEQLSKELAMVQGLITTKDVLFHAPAIVRNFGLRRYLRCLAALLTRRRTTFLELVWSR